MTKYYIDIQQACDDSSLVEAEKLQCWIIHTLQSHYSSAEMTLRIVNVQEITQLNSVYRQKNTATNVLSFPASHPHTIELATPLLGDVVICPTIIQEESAVYQIPLETHWAHIVVHGVLHLLGYDHIETDDERIMQTQENRILTELGFQYSYA